MNWKAEKPRADELAEQLAGMGRVDVTRFFSGVSLKLDGIQFAFLFDGSLFLRVDDVNRPAFASAGMRPFSYAGRTKTVIMDSYYEAPAEVLEDFGELHRWCRDAYRAAVGASAKSRRAKRK